MRTTTSTAKKRAERRGRRAEWLAALCLLLKGYRIAARNFRVKQGEVDIIARKGDLVVFVEVKARNSEAAALDAITASSKRRIENAGTAWLQRQPDTGNLSWRNDVIAVMPRRWPVHIEDVW